MNVESGVIGALVALLAAAVAMFVAYTKGHNDGAAKVKSKDIKNEVEARQTREEALERADAAADRVRVDVGNSPDKLREPDPFRRAD